MGFVCGKHLIEYFIDNIYLHLVLGNYKHAIYCLSVISIALAVVLKYIFNNMTNT